ncbi:MAG: tripartite tricarboxylate transporter substrate-binding protein [Pseudomonadota bacterium]
MNRRDSLKALSAIAASSAVPFGQNTFAQSGYPNKPIRLINPFPAGGGTDVFARPYGVKLGAALGQAIIVENLGGAGGTVGAAVAAKATADGYALFIGAIHHTIAESLYLNKPYKLEQDFMPITVLAYVPNVLVINPKLPFKKESELRAYMKANPGKVNYGSAGSGASHHLAGELYKLSAGVDGARALQGYRPDDDRSAWWRGRSRLRRSCLIERTNQGRQIDPPRRNVAETFAATTRCANHDRIGLQRFHHDHMVCGLGDQRHTAAHR